MICERIAQLVEYAVRHRLITEEDRIWATNRLLDAMGEDEYTVPENVCDCDLEEILSSLCDIAAEKGLPSPPRDGIFEPPAQWSSRK